MVKRDIGLETDLADNLQKYEIIIQTSAFMYLTNSWEERWQFAVGFMESSQD